MANDKMEKSLQHIKEKHKEIFDAYENFGKMIHTEGGPLDEKTRILMKVCLSAANRTPNALKVHICKALEIGCNLTEVEHAIFLTATTIGFPAMMESYVVFRDVVDDVSPMKKVVLANIISH